MSAQRDTSHIRFISAGAGSGKTYRITQELQEMLAAGHVNPGGVIATTFTRRAATELRERVRQKLMAEGNAELATQMGQALIGTVNGVCGELLARFAFEAGLSPDQKVLEEQQADRLFGAALEEILAEEPHRIRELNALADRLGVRDRTTRQLTWRAEIMKVAADARANAMAPDTVRAFAADSTATLLALFPKPYPESRDLDAELLGAINTARTGIDPEIDTTGVTRKYLDLLEQLQAALIQRRMEWAEWAKLAKSAPGAKSRPFAEPIQQIAGDFEKHPKLHADITRFIDEVFALAAASIEAYQRIKAEQGLLDFVDQERRVFDLLDDEHVRATLADELEVLFVDEFQDTSPIQLALFMKLARLASRVIWVGDIKQAIYGFRGSDPELMQAVLGAIEAGGGTTDVLEHSWRSRPSLVSYINEIFVPAFANRLERKQVALAPKRAPRDGAGLKEAAVACWHLAGSNWDKRANDIAFGIHRLVESGYRIADMDTHELKAAGYGDIAVLCRTNDRLKVIASACARAGIPVAFKRPGLLETPEGALALAALRRLADARDTLASAEIRTLARSESPEQWLPERLAFIANDAEDAPRPWEWGETGEDAWPELAAIAEVRAARSLMTPREALEAALVKGRVREAAIGWGPTADRTRHRLRNIDLLLNYAAEYEDQCNQQNVAATVPGLILWLYELEQREEDWQAEASDGRAVTLVTHHRAKGLEWPVVLAVDLDSEIKTRLWGLNVLQREAGFDIEDPLGGRRLRYWPWPFGMQSSGIPVGDSAESSAAGIAAREAAVEETKRLLYVSLTRARDKLIVPLHAKKPSGEWLETLGAGWMLPDGEVLTLPDGTAVPSACEVIEAPEEWVAAAAVEEARWVLPGMPREDLVSRNLSPSAAAPVEGAKVGEIIEIGERLEIKGAADMTALGEALHSIIAAEINVPEGDSAHRAARVLKEWGFEGVISPEVAIASARGFISWANRTFDSLAWRPEHPIVYVNQNGQVVQGFIDVLLKTTDGYVVLDHKSSARPRNDWSEVARRYSGQMAMYVEAVNQGADFRVHSAWIHFAVGGGVLSIGGSGNR
jgi:ATP-dependent exoDNAse (exonuclease V) beta subunit